MKLISNSLRSTKINLIYFIVSDLKEMRQLTVARRVDLACVIRLHVNTEITPRYLHFSNIVMIMNYVLL